MTTWTMIEQAAAQFRLAPRRANEAGWCNVCHDRLQPMTYTLFVGRLELRLCPLHANALRLVLPDTSQIARHRQQVLP